MGPEAESPTVQADSPSRPGAPTSGDPAADASASPVAVPAREPRFTLRARLIVLVSLLTAAGLLVVALVTYVSLRDFLLQRVDEQLMGSRFPVAVALAVPGDAQDLPGATQVVPGTAAGDRGGPREVLPPGTYGELLDGDGVVLEAVAFTYGGDAPSPPELPDDIESIAITAGDPFREPPDDAPDGAAITVRPQEGDGPDYRVAVTHFPALDRYVVVAVPLDEVDDTLARLLTIEVVVSLVVLGILALTTWLLVRRELRPLEAMAADAAAIASGDLSRRVSRSGARTEVGRLGAALNAMLAQIEGALGESRASEERLRRFLADASHELRTPLTSIRGYAELFRRGADRDADDLALAMRRIEEEGGRMGVIVDDLLLLSRLDQGRPLQHEPVDLVTLAEDAVADARAADAGREVSLVAPDDCVVAGDEDRLRQALANLLSNAIRHTPAGTSIRVTVAPEQGPDGDEAVLTVDDDGAGIDPADRERVFEPFHRGPGAVDEKSGAGLGLAIVAAVVKAHAGTVTVADAPGGGARLAIRLPLRAADDTGLLADGTDPTVAETDRSAGQSAGHDD